jgi:hypothetical protein
VVRESIQALGFERVVDLRDDVPEPESVRLYQDCTATVPVGDGRLQLTGARTSGGGPAVILSDIPVHKENFGRAAIFVSAANPQTWRRAFATLDNQQEIEEAMRRWMQVMLRA